nr:hypothetical protein [uncultured Pseudogulbenkiania sp.]
MEYKGLKVSDIFHYLYNEYFFNTDKNMDVSYLINEYYGLLYMRRRILLMRNFNIGDYFLCIEIGEDKIEMFDDGTDVDDTEILDMLIKNLFVNRELNENIISSGKTKIFKI